MANKGALNLLLNKKVLGIAALAAGGVATVLTLTGKEVPPAPEAIEDPQINQAPEIIPAEAIAGTIAAKLKEEGVQLLGSLDTDFKKWEVIMAKYKKHASEKGLVISGGFGMSLDNLDVRTFAGWCIEKSQSKEEDQKTVSQIKEFCSVPKTKDYLERDKKRLIQKGSQEWANSLRRYVDTSKPNRMTISELGTNVVDPKIIEGWCTKNSDGEYEEKKYGLITSFCTENIN